MTSADNTELLRAIHEKSEYRETRRAYVAVMQTWGRSYGLQPPKGGIARDIPIPAKTSEYLRKVIDPGADAESFVFYGVDPYIPIDHKTVAQGLYDALAAIEIDEKERRDRNITFHSWRHFFNTVRRNRIPDYKLRLLTGHRTEAMTEHYTHISLEDFTDLAKVQEEVFK